MQAIVAHRYGDLRLEEIDEPGLEPGRVRVRVRAAAVNPLDYHELRGTPLVARPMLGLTRPKHARRGVDVAGVVEAVAPDVTEFAPGDEVFGSARGAFAEFVRPLATTIVPKPERLSFEESAAIPVAGITALQGLRDKGGVQAGQRVLVNGAAGGVGTFAVQIAVALGAEVTGVCSTRNVDLVRSLGAAHVVDYTQEDFARAGQRYDVVFNCVDARSLADLKRPLVPGGRLVLAAGTIRQMLTANTTRRFSRERVVAYLARITKDDLLALKELVDDGKVTPVIDRSYPLRETPDAIRYVEAGHARGKVVITL